MNTKQSADTSRFGKAFAPQPLEELEAEDKKAIEQAYIASYHYTTAQKIGGFIAISVVLSLVIMGIVTLFMNLIDLFVNAPK